MIKQCPNCLLKFNTDTSPYCAICVTKGQRKRLNKKFPPKYLMNKDRNIASFMKSEIKERRKTMSHSHNNQVGSKIIRETE